MKVFDWLCHFKMIDESKIITCFHLSQHQSNYRAYFFLQRAGGFYWCNWRQVEGRCWHQHEPFQFGKRHQGLSWAIRGKKFSSALQRLSTDEITAKCIGRKQQNYNGNSISFLCFFIRLKSLEKSLHWTLKWLFCTNFWPRHISFWWQGWFHQPFPAKKILLNMEILSNFWYVLW